MASILLDGQFSAFILADYWHHLTKLITLSSLKCFLYLASSILYISDFLSISMVIPSWSTVLTPLYYSDFLILESLKVQSWELFFSLLYLHLFPCCGDCILSCGFQYHQQSGVKTFISRLELSHKFQSCISYCVLDISTLMLTYISNLMCMK